MTVEVVRSESAIRDARRKRIGKTFSQGLLIAVAILVSLPVLWMIITSLKTDSEYLSYPITIFPERWQWRNYLDVFDPRYRFLRHTGITVFLAMMFATLTVLSSSLVGYAFARFQDVKGNKGLFSIVIAMIAIPMIVTVIPQFVIFSRIGITGTFWPWVLWGLAGSPYHIFLFRQFFLGFPRELEDAAEVDGCTPFGTYWRIFLPNAKAALATSFILNFVWVWGDWFTGLIFLKTSNATLPVLLENAFKDPQGNDLRTLTLAACVLYVLPLVVTFFIGQRYILKGVVTSGLRG